MYERERVDAEARIRAAGGDLNDFDFSMSYQEPDPDGGGMFTVRYDVIVKRISTGQSFSAMGGIGLRWVDEFADAIAAGRLGAL